MTAYNSFAVQTKAQQARQTRIGVQDRRRAGDGRRRAATTPTATSPATPARAPRSNDRMLRRRRRAHRQGPPGQPRLAPRPPAPGRCRRGSNSRPGAAPDRWHRMACKIHAAMRNRTLPSTARSSPSSPLRRCRARRLLALARRAAQAEKADRFKPLNVEADLPGKIDLLNQFVVFNGNVVVTKGTMTIRADRIEVRESPDGYHTAVAFGSPSQHATFRQKRDAPDEYIDGDAERLEYDGKSDVIRFVNNASVRRLRGGEASRRDLRQPRHLRQQHRGLQRHRRRAGDGGQPGRPRPRGADAQEGSAAAAEAARAAQRRRPARRRSCARAVARGAAMSAAAAPRAAAPPRGAAACASRTARAPSSTASASASRAARSSACSARTAPARRRAST